MEDNTLKKFTTAKFISFAIGFFGLQFAWQMRIILSGPVTEELGASPFIFGLIWLAGPFTGMVVQPLIGALSDKTKTPLGRRRPYLLGGALLSAFPCLAQILIYDGSAVKVRTRIERDEPCLDDFRILTDGDRSECKPE